MNILVIGGAGYIGSHVTREFLDMGFRCTVYDNLSSGLRENLFIEADFIHADIHDYTVLLGAMKQVKFDALVHLAASKAAGESMLNPEKYLKNNIAGTVNIINAASEAGIKNIVFSSSAAVYGSPQYLPIDENHPTLPENFYGFTKLEIEHVLNWYDKLRNIRYASLRYFNAAGYDIKGRIKGLEQNPANLLPIIMETAIGTRKEMQVYGKNYDTPDGTCIRDYVHVNDLAIGHAKALDYIIKNNKSLIINLGSEQGYSVTEVLETARKITGKPIPSKVAGRRSGDPAKLTASCSLAFELLGWKAKYSDLETLIKTSWAVYINHRVTQSYGNNQKLPRKHHELLTTEFLYRIKT
ncbi:MAG: UDP-glucose 4-epimerase GalE [Treponema sp.]|nr:UDP-glucose 4-epimerase GalE [Treponema sp.]